MIKALIFLLFTVALVSCTRNIGEMPKDFDFKYSFDQNCLNTFDSTYSVNGVRTSKGELGDTVIKLILTTKEKKAIYKIMMENDLMEMPLNFHSDSRGEFASDMREDHLIVQANKTTKVVTYYYGYIHLKVKWSKRYIIIANYLDSLISSKKEIKALPSTCLFRA